MENRKTLFLFILFLTGFLFFRQSALAAEGSVYPIDGPGTISVGNQGLFVYDDLPGVKFVEIEKAQPPLLESYTSGFDIRMFAFGLVMAPPVACQYASKCSS